MVYLFFEPQGALKILKILKKLKVRLLYGLGSTHDLIQSQSFFLQFLEIFKQHLI